MPRLYGTRSLPKHLFAVACLAVAGCGDGVEFTDDGTRCAIESFGWVGVSRNDGKTNLEIGGHPASLGGGGDRIFPDRNNPISQSATPNDDDLHDRVIARLRLKTAPARFSGVHVRFELQDPDHYSSDSMHDPNGPSEPDDNIRAGNATPDSPGARLMDRDFKTQKQEELLVGNGERKDIDIGVQLLHLQPGNNWKVKATCTPGTIGTTEETGPQFVPLLAAAAVSNETPTLTVWRLLRVEFDRMEDPVFTRGPAPSKFEKGSAKKLNATNFLLTLPGGQEMLHPDQFRDGEIVLTGPNGLQLRRRVVRSVGRQVEIAEPVTDVVTGFIDLVDDDIAGGDPALVTSSDDMQIRARLWEEKLKPALIVPVFSEPTVMKFNSTVPFVPHLASDAPLLHPNDADKDEISHVVKIIRDNKGSAPSEPGFWVVYVLGGFQGHFARSRDPKPEPEREPEQDIKGDGGVIGVTVDFFTAKPDNAGSIVFAETLRDVVKTSTVKVSISNLRELASLHEVGHQFGLNHSETLDGTIMGHAPSATGEGDPLMLGADTQDAVDSMRFAGSALKRMALVKQPGHNK